MLDSEPTALIKWIPILLYIQMHPLGHLILYKYFMMIPYILFSFIKFHILDFVPYSLRSPHFIVQLSPVLLYILTDLQTHHFYDNVATQINLIKSTHLK